MDGEVHIDGLPLDSVMPVVKAWGNKESFDQREAPIQIGMHEGGVQIHQEDVRVHGGLAETQHHHRNHRGAAERDNFEEMHPRTSHPVHAARRVMDRVKFPESRDAVKCTVHPVLHEVCQEHDGYALHQEGKSSDPFANACQWRDCEHRLRWEKCEESQHLHHEAADEVIEKILSPFFTEERLISVPRENPLDRNEEEAGEDDVQDKEIQAEEQWSRIRYQARCSRTAEQCRQQGGNDSECAENLSRSQRQADCREREGAQQDDVQAEAKARVAMQRPNLGHGKKPGSAKR